MNNYCKTTFVAFIFLLHCLGINAQSNDSVRRSLAFTQKQLIVPSTFVATGLVLSGNMKEDASIWLNKFTNPINTNIDNALAISPIAIAYSLDFLGIKSETDFWNRSAILLKSELMMLTLVYSLKYSISEMRPDGSNTLSFPSNHSAQAFLGATFLTQEYKQKLPWVPYLAYSIAATTGALRVINNKHFLNDILVGAGIGIISQKVAYWTHQYRWNKKRNFVYIDF